MIFISFSSLFFEGVSDGKTFIYNLLFVGGNLSNLKEGDLVAGNHQGSRKCTINNYNRKLMLYNSFENCHFAVIPLDMGSLCLHISGIIYDCNFPRFPRPDKKNLRPGCYMSETVS